MMSENDLHVHGNTHSITSTQLLFSDAHYKNKRYEHFMVSQSDLQVHACTLLNS